MRVPKRTANLIMNALQGGVVPRTGLGYIAVGREHEVSALLQDIEIIMLGGATIRFVTGIYGSGKTFLLQTIKEHAMAKGFIVADADLSPNRSLIGNVTRKKGLATYRELMGNLSSKTAPTGGALAKIFDIWLNDIWMQVAQKSCSSGISGGDLEQMVANNIYETILNMQELVHGYDFANMLTLYWKASRANDIEMKAKVLRWFRGEYQTKTEAKNSLGVNVIINDDDWFEYIKIFSNFFATIGYKGFIIIIDELINIYKSTSTIARQNNYEKMLTMYNDTLQGRAKYLGIIFGGTPRSVEDMDRGVFSYEALKSRLSTGKYGSSSMVNMMIPIIRILPLTKEEIFVLLEKLGEIHSDLYGYKLRVEHEDIAFFIKTSLIEKDDITPRSIIRDYIEVLNLMYQNPDTSIEKILNTFIYSIDVENGQEVVD